MASPTKNFQNPTTLSRLGPVMPVNAVAPRLAVMLTAGFLPNNFHKWWTVQVDVQGPRSGGQMTPRIPIPPMGRQLILTFPPIYKSRQGIKIGQIYPPPAP